MTGRRGRRHPACDQPTSILGRAHPPPCRGLRDNQLTGPVPTSWGALRYLAHVDLAGNKGMCGPVPGVLTSAVAGGGTPPNGTMLFRTCPWAATGAAGFCALGWGLKGKLACRGPYGMTPSPFNDHY